LVVYYKALWDRVGVPAADRSSRDRTRSVAIG